MHQRERLHGWRRGIVCELKERKENIMKKTLCTVLALALMLVLAACGGASSGASSPTPAAPASSAASASGEAASGAWTPAENVTMIVAYKAGSGTDNTARVIPRVCLPPMPKSMSAKPL